MENSIEEFEEIIISYFEEIEDFITKSNTSRFNSNKKYKTEESKIDKLSDFRMLIDGLFLKISRNFYTPTKEINDNISYQISICASFLRTHFLINKLIMDGDIIEATTLIRKQLEASTRFSELEKKEIIKLTKKTPNVNNESKGVTKELYSTLSEIAHTGSLDVANLITIIDENEKIARANIFPFFSIDSLQSYKFQAYVSFNFLGKYILFTKKIYPENNIDQEMKMFVILHKLINDISLFKD
ncbi:MULTISPECIES: hypothetical protein [Empedobacter]|uniref:Uncharacterized protein n=1 Tax=Empedobacter falsenii TaxID=343874 RepID=A0AAW7DH98_9FLAO|nr:MULTISPECIES: hypothetical protein [Empedobacter]MDM1550522.1 hypothetical protein [Empedobacter falsenii]